jgi:hypothetical protein
VVQKLVQARFDYIGKEPQELKAKKKLSVLRCEIVRSDNFPENERERRNTKTENPRVSPDVGGKWHFVEFLWNRFGGRRSI